VKLKSTQRKSLATVPSVYQGQERRFAQTVSENLDVLTGRRGDIIDRAVTFRDLLDTGVLKLVKGLGTGSTKNGVSVTNPATNPDGLPIQLPTQPENFVAAGGFDVIFLSWSLPPYNGHDYVEIYRLQRVSGAAEPTLVQAEAAGVYTRYYGDVYRFTDTNVGSQENWYYWIRAVNKNGIAGPYYSSTGVNTTTALDYLYISGLINDILDDDVNNLGLNTAIDAIDVNVTALENFTGYTSTYNGDSLITRMGDVETLAGDAATSAQLQTESTTRASADTALSSQITTLNSTVSNPTTGLAATYSGLQTEITTRASADSALATRATNLESTVNNATTGVAATYSGLVSEQTTRANADSALSSDLTSLTSTVSGNTTSISTQATTINGIEGKYAVKIDNNDHVSGFGLISTANDGVVTSSFIVASDRFAIAAPFNASTADDAAVGTNYPFKVLTTSTTVNGVSIPAGVYIDDAFIHDAQITNAMIKDAEITTAKISDLSATKITSGNITIDNSNSIAIRQGKTAFGTAGNGFWLGNNNNYGSFIVGSGNKSYLKFDGSTGVVETRGLTIKAVDGTTLVRAGGNTGGNGNNLVYNGAMSVGEYTLNESTGNWTQSTTATEGWTQYSGDSTVIFRPALQNPYIRCGGDGPDADTTRDDPSYARTTSQRFPVVAGEKLYVYALTSNAADGQYLAIAFYDHADGEVTTGYATQVNRANSNGTLKGELQVVNGSNRRYWVAEIEVPERTVAPYANFGEIRIGSNTGAHVYYYSVGVSRSPPVIDPSYASTYIRDLSVDTLQIAGNAVTVADSASNFPTGFGTNKVTLEKETSLLPQGSAIIWLINAIVNDTSGNPDSYDLVVNIYTRGVNQTSYPSSPTHTKIIYIYSKSLDARMMEFPLPATSAFTDGGYMKCSVRLQTHVNNQTNYTSGTLVNGGGIEIVYLGAKK
jgi:hypothetical protein